MSGRHLRRGRGPVLRALLVACGVLLVGAALGAGGSLLLEERPGNVRTEGEGGTSTAELVPDAGPITIALLGDVAGGGGLAVRLEGPAADLLGPLADVLDRADLTVAGVDAPIVEDPGTAEVPTAPASVLAALDAGGVDVVSAAGDRSLDLGTEGLYQTLGADEGLGMLVGIGADEARAYQPFVRRIGGHTVAVLAATQLLDADRIATDTAGPEQEGVASAKRVDRLVAEVEAARAEADTVVVYVHWGEPGETCPTAGQQELAAALVAAGADVVAGPGSGRVQGAGRSDGAAVAYGVGRLLADEPDGESGALLVRIDGREVLDIEWVPARLRDGVPTPLDGAEADAARAEWEDRRGCTELTP